MSLYDIKVETLAGKPTTLGEFKGKALLIVNVASQCGLTPQYAGLQALYQRHAGDGLEILGFPCNQFGGQEPGTAEDIKSFCETSFGVTFPLFSKIEVNGDNRHPLYRELTAVADESGHSGDIRWNFEKFLVSPDGNVVARFNPTIAPDDPSLEKEIDNQLMKVSERTIDLTAEEALETN